MSNQARNIIENAISGSLGTIAEDGSPFVSLVTIAAVDPTTLVMLLSGLAKHTQNLDQRSACSLLLVQPGGEGGDPLAGARLTISGTATRLERGQDAQARETFLAKHEAASMYADFGDFAFFEIDVREAHLVAGFGRIETILAEAL
ncbi:MAG: HugZ family protein [Rubripirellula sp.]